FDQLFDMPTGPMPAGEYSCELVSGRIGQSKNGNRRYELRAKIAEGDYAGRAIFDDFYLTGSAWWKTKPFLEKLGIDNADKLRRELPAGLLARVKLKIESYDGIPRNKIADLAIVGRRPAADVP